MNRLDSTTCRAVRWGCLSSLGVPGNSRQSHRPPASEEFGSVYESHSKFEHPHIRRATVASQHCVTPGKTNGLLCCDSQGWRNPGNGHVIDRASTAYVPVTENKPYLTVRFSDSSGMAVCL